MPRADFTFLDNCQQVAWLRTEKTAGAGRPQNGWKMMRKSNLKIIAAAVATALGAVKLQAGTNGTYSLVGTSGGVWSNSANWTGGTIADGQDGIATFGTPTVANTVSLDTVRTIGELNFSNGSTTLGWTLSNTSGSSLTLSTSTGLPIINVAGATDVISATLTGTQGFVKTGTGSLTLSGVNTYTGNTNVSGGTLTVSSDSNMGSTSGSLILNGASFYSGNATFARNIVAIGTDSFTAGGTTTFNGNLSGGAILNGPAINGSVTQFYGNDSGFTGTFTSNYQTNLQTATAGSAAAAWVGNGNGNTNTFIITDTTTPETVSFGSLTGTSTSTVRGSSGTNQLVTLRIGDLGTSTTWAGDIRNGGSSGGLFGVLKVGAGTFTLSGTNSPYTGVTNISAGTLSVPQLTNGGVSSSMGAATNAAGNLIFSGGTLLYTGATVSTDRNFTISPGVNADFNVSSAAAVVTMSGVTPATTGGFIKDGAGILSWSGTQVYSGNTTINAGALLLKNGTISNSAVTSGAAGTFGGTGNLATAYTQTAGTLAPGSVGTIGQLNMSSGATLSGGALAIDIGGGGTSDLLNVTGNLNLSAVTALNVNVLTGATSGSYDIINYSGSLTGNTANLTLPPSRTFSLGTATANQITLIYNTAGAATLNWNSSGSGAWDVITSSNWSNTGTNSQDNFYQGDNVNFGDGSGLQTAITLNTSVSPGSVTVGANTNNYVISGTSGIAGIGTLTLNGSSTFTLATNNSYGATTINSGTLVVGTGSTVGTLGTGSVVNNSALVFNRSDGVTIANNISGSGLVTFAGAGTSTLTGTSTYTGNTLVAAGTLAIPTATALAAASNLVFTGGSLNVTSGVTIANAMAFNSGTASLTTVSGTGLFTGAMSGPGTISIPSFAQVSGDATAFTGTLTAVGQFNIGYNGQTLGTLNGVPTLLSTSASAAYINNYSVANGNGFIVASDGNFTANMGSLAGTVTTAYLRGSNSTASNFGTTGTFGTITLSIGALNTSTTYAGIIANNSSTAVGSANVLALTKVGSGVLTLTNTNYYSGPTNLSGGTLAVAVLANGGTASGIGQSSNAASNLNFLGGALAYTGGTTSIDRNFTAAAGTQADFNVSSAATTLTISGAASTAGGLTKDGPGTLILTGGHTYTGPTIVNSGTLLVNSPGSLSNTSAITIGSTGTFGGTGTINVPYSQTSGTLAPGGVGTVGTLTLASGAALAGGTLALDITTGTSDLLNVQGNLTLTGTTVLNVPALATVGAGSYEVIDYSGSLSGSPASLYVSSRSANVSAGASNINPGENALFINVSSTGISANLNWNSTSSGAFDLVTSPNWLNTGTNTQDYFYQGDAVTFGDGAGLQPNITISGSLSPASVVVNSNAINYNFSGSGALTGSASFTKQGSSTLVIATANTFTGAVDINGGTTIVTAAGALGTGGLTIDSGATLQVGVGTAAGSLSNSSITDNGVLTYNLSTGVTLGVISGSGMVNYLGSGGGAATALMTYSGGTNISAGTVSLSNTNPTTPFGSGPINVYGGGQIGMFGTITLANAITLGGAAIHTGFNSPSTLTGPVTLSSAFTLAADGGSSLALTGSSFNTGGYNVTIAGNQTFKIATTTANFGTTNFASTASTTSGSSFTLAPPSGSTYSIAGNFTSGVPVIVTGGGTVVLSGNNSNTSLVLHDGTTLQLQANAGNTVAGTSSVIGNLAASAFQFSDGDYSSATLQLRSDSSVIFSGTTTGNQTGNTTLNFDVNNIAGISGSGPQGKTLSFGTLGTFATTINVTGGNGYTLALGGISTAYSTVDTLNAVSANVTIGAIGTTLPTGGLNLTANGGTITATGAITNTGPVIVTGTNNTTISGALSGTTVTMNGSGVLTLSGSNTTTGLTQVNSGTLNFAPNFSTGINTVTLAGGLSIASGGVAQISPASITSSRTFLKASSLSFSGGTDSWAGKLNLSNDDLDVQAGNLTNLTNQVKEGFAAGTWNGTGGIVSSTAAGNTSHLTAIGVIQNSVDQNGGSALVNLFDGQSVSNTDVLLKYTYYGDTNLDGKVDASDYSRIDSGFLTHATGWFNGDFNYDGVINGSDYTLIDNAFNTQGAILAADIAGPSAVATAEIAFGTSSVPEPATLGLLGIGTLAMLGRRRRK